jgi:hypothetical protein
LTVRAIRIDGPRWPFQVSTKVTAKQSAFVAGSVIGQEQEKRVIEPIQRERRSQSKWETAATATGIGGGNTASLVILRWTLCPAANGLAHGSSVVSYLGVKTQEWMYEVQVRNRSQKKERWHVSSYSTIFERIRGK